jgi:hypothetical protein
VDDGSDITVSRVSSRFHHGAPSLTEGPMAVCSWGPARIDLFSTQGNGRIIHAWQDGSLWSSEVIPTPPGLLPTLTVTTWGPGRLDLFAVTSKNKVAHAVWTSGAGAWTWETLSPSQPLVGLPEAAAPGLPVTIDGPLTATSWGEGRLDLFALGGRDRAAKSLFHGSFDGAWTWQELFFYAPPPASAPSAAWLKRDTWTDRDRAYVEIAIGPLERDWYTGPLSAISVGPNKLDVFGRTASGRILRVAWRDAWKRRYYDAPE